MKEASGLTYDLIVIGAGPGGYPAALHAAGLGKRVAVVERLELGGTCLNRGCIPTKTLLHATGLYRSVKMASEEGVIAKDLVIDGERLRKRKEEVVKTLGEGIAAQLKRDGICVYAGRGVVHKENRVAVHGDGETIYLESKYILIATGCVPAVPPIPGIGLEGVITSDQMLERVDFDLKSLVIIGGGVIGMEFAQMYGDAGCKVTVVEAMDRILPGMDREISQNLKLICKRRGVEIHTGAAVKEIRKSEALLTCVYEEGGALLEATGERVLVAVGRRPNTKGVFSEDFEAFGTTAGSVVDEKGRILVDQGYRTAIEGVYAIGDVIGGVELAHVATAEGICAVDEMWGRESSFDRSVVPSCVYTDPEIAVVGLGADEAKKAGIDVRVGKYLMSSNGKSVLSGQERGFIKLVEREDAHAVIGAQLMCARATDLIGEIELAIMHGMGARQLAELIMPHPTFCEGIGEAARGLIKS